MIWYGIEPLVPADPQARNRTLEESTNTDSPRIHCSSDRYAFDREGVR